MGISTDNGGAGERVRSRIFNVKKTQRQQLPDSVNVQVGIRCQSDPKTA